MPQTMEGRHEREGAGALNALRRLRARLLRSGREGAAAALQRVPEGPRDAFLARLAALMPSPYHEGELAVQERAGTRKQGARSGLGVGAELPRKGADLLARQGFIALTAADAEGLPWVTMLEGPRGFLQALDPLQVSLAAAVPATDPLATALSGATEVGLLAIDFETKERLRIEGRSSPDANGGMTLRVRTSLENCPRYVRKRLLERVETRPGPTRALDGLDEDTRARLRASDILFIGSRHPKRGADASHKAGRPGFVHLDDEDTLTLPDYEGNGMFQTLGNLSVDHRVGLLVPDFVDGTVVQVTGRARIDWAPESLGAFRGAQRLTRIRVDQVRVHPGRLGWRLPDESATPEDVAEDSEPGNPG